MSNIRQALEPLPEFCRRCRDLLSQTAGDPARRAEQLAPALQAALLHMESLERERNQLLHEQRRQTGLVGLSDLTSIVTHHFNNILNDIVLQLAVLEQGGLSAEAQAEVKAIGQRSREAARLVKELQNHGRRYHPPPGPVDINATVREAVAASPTAAARIRLELAPELTTVHAAAPDVQRIVSLLIANAAAAPFQGDGVIVVRTVQETDGLQVRVEDTGPPVARADLARLFELFTPVRPGADGFSLSICRSLARRHLADLHAENRPEGGMAFVLKFRSHR
jgi:signal transduction histidine kinase